MKIKAVVETKTSQSARVRQLEGMFDCPTPPMQRKEWEIDASIDDESWNIGLIMGPSGSGKTTVARAMFGEKLSQSFDWSKNSVLDCFPDEVSMDEITDICRAVGFNTIPAWMRPFDVLSNGEKFRVDIARRLIEQKDPIVVDEFTSVVDRQVAKIASAAVARFVRKNGRKFVAVSCHEDIVEWLQPDWIIDPSVGSFLRRSVRRRPELEIEIRRVHNREWARFSPFHYMTAELNHAAKCFVAFCDGEPAAFCGVLYRPHPKVRDIYGVSRLVTLPDYQGFGIGPKFTDVLASCYVAIGKRFRMYPAHPSLIRSYNKSTLWSLERKPGGFATFGNRSTIESFKNVSGRPCAVFEYRGPSFFDAALARRLIESPA
jgi:ABC-type ATPase involved in cell division/GNAT superfamily N-acetyltransferase